MNKKTKPNLFEISTKELSQDGFFTWLLQWANPHNKQYDKKLNACASAFVNFLINKNSDKDSEIKIESILVACQWDIDNHKRKVDIAAYVNEKYLIIIEDKTNSGERSNQLEHYKKRAEDWCKRKKDHELICIYLKTGAKESKLSKKEIEKKGFSYIDRSDLISFFNNYSNIKNDIYLDFVEKINNLDDPKKAIEKKRINNLDEELLWETIFAWNPKNGG